MKPKPTKPVTKAITVMTFFRFICILSFEVGNVEKSKFDEIKGLGQWF